MEQKKRKPAVLVGAGGHAEVVIEILNASGGWNVIGVVTRDGSTEAAFSLPSLGTDSVLPELFARGTVHSAIGVGGFRDNVARRNVFNNLKRIGYTCVTAIHPSAIISPSSHVGEGSVVFPGALLHTNVQIGDNAVIATHATVDHGTRVENHALISAGVSVGADVCIGEGALLAIGCTVVSGIRIGSNSLVAAGAVVTTDVPAGATVFGVPARPRG